MARTTRTHHLPMLGFLLMAALLPLAPVQAASAEPQGDDGTRIGMVELRVAATGAVTTASLAATWQPFLEHLQQDLTTIVGASPGQPLVVRFTGSLPDAGQDDWIRLAGIARINDDVTAVEVDLDRFLALSDPEAHNTIRNILARRWLTDASEGALPDALVAGFARYLETPVLARQARQASLAQQAYLDGDLPGWQDIMTSTEAMAALDPDAGQASRLALAAFLVERYGANMVADLARAFASSPGTDPAATVAGVTGQPAGRLDAAWDDFIAAWFAGGWRANAFAALDLQPARDLFARGAYEAAVDRANQTLQVTTALNDEVASAEAEMVVARGSVGMQAEALMADAETALDDHVYDRAMTLIDRAQDQYALLPEDHRPASLIETWRGIAADGMDAIGQFDNANNSYDDWFAMRDTRRNAVEAGTTFARLGDSDRRATAHGLVDDLDARVLRLVLALGSAILLLVGWLLVWSWHRAPGRLRWPTLIDAPRREKPS